MESIKEKHMERQNFVIIGAAKAGTTSLYDYLAQHPQIYMPGKETNFFCQGNLKKYSCQTDSIKFSIVDKYKTLFKGVSNEIVIGEVCPAYMHEPEIAERIFSYIPHAKIIAILRHPVDRAYPNFLHCRLLGWKRLLILLKPLRTKRKFIFPTIRNLSIKSMTILCTTTSHQGFIMKSSSHTLTGLKGVRLKCI